MVSPSIFGALDYGAVVPLVGIIEVIGGRHSPVLMVVVALHGAVAGALWASVGLGMHTAAIGFAVATAACWAGTVAIVGRTATAPTVVLVGVSPTAFVTAWPLALSPFQWHRTAAIVIRFVQLFALMGVFVLAQASVLHAAWGCYPPGAPLSAHDRGMCGDAVSSRQTGPGFICRDNSYADPGTCAPSGSPVEFYGDLVAFVVHVELLALILWAAAYVDLVVEVGPPKASDESRSSAVSAATPFI